MIIKEQEIRTENLNLLMCKMKLTEDNNLILELKNGKRIENMSLEALVRVINEFTGHVPSLHITKR